MSLQQFSSFLSKRKNQLTLGVSALCAVAVLAGGAALINTIRDQAQASSSVTPLRPGQIGEFTVYYINAGDSDVETGVVNIDIGPKLDYIEGSLRETFGNESTARCITDSGIVTPVGNATQVIYRPNSSTSTAAPCNGLGGEGPVTGIIPAPSADISNPSTWPAEATGKIVFRAMLRPENADPDGYVIGNSALDLAISAQATFDGKSGGRSDAKVEVVKDPLVIGDPVATTANPIVGAVGDPMPPIQLNNSNVPTSQVVNFTPTGCTTPIAGTISADANTGNNYSHVWQPTSGAVIPECATTGAQTGTLSAPGANNVPVPTNFSTPVADLTPSDIGPGTCTPNPVTAGQTTTCTFDVIGTDGPYAIPDGEEFKAVLDDPAGTPSDACTLQTVSGNQTLVCENVPTTGVQPGQQPVDVNQYPVGETTPTGTADNVAQVDVTGPAPTDLTTADIGPGTCTPNPVTAGQTTTCTFDVIGTDGPYAIPDGEEFKAVLDDPADAGIPSSNCVLQLISGQQALVCENVPTAGVQPGQQPVDVNQYPVGETTPASTADNKAEVTVQAPVVPVVGQPGGRLYCVGDDNAPVNWDPVLEYNTNCNRLTRNQKFQDGPMKFVFDELKDAQGNALTSGQCKFELLRHPRAYTPANILTPAGYNNTANIVNGKAEVTLAVTSQTINYYFVVGTCTSGQTTIQDSMLVLLYVGG